MIRQFIKKIIYRYHDLIDRNLFSEAHPYWAEVDHGNYDQIYLETYQKTNTRSGISRRDRFYNLYTALTASNHLKGATTGDHIVECGVFHGHSSLIMLSRLKELDSKFDGEGYYAVDSFEGLSKPSEKDDLGAEWEGKMHADFEKTSKVLKSAFPKVNVIKGYIPEVLKYLPDETYRFVHIDVDLANPTIDALNFFYPRLLVGGAIIIDDYGFKLWSGTKRAIDSFMDNKKDLYGQPLSTGQYLLIKYR